ncbi:MAG: molybdenum cofactor guanylyltransferase [Gammaproteobacteria bacterium]|nr:molybdenum cofactor guanylyltransferase [Gammaproteobacteria bacterium]
MKQTNLSAVVLSGGQSSRIKVADKGLVELAGQPMIHYVLHNLHLHLTDISISTHTPQTTYQQFGYPLINDQYNDYLGPLAGIHAALSHAKTQNVFIVPCDCPFLNTQVISERLSHAQQQHQARLVVAHDGYHIQPTIALIDRVLLDSLEQYIKRGGRRLMLWFKEEQALEVDFSDHKDMFFNINTPGDIEQAEVYLNSQYK